jgi:hypothetical protein
MQIVWQQKRVMTDRIKDSHSGVKGVVSSLMIHDTTTSGSGDRAAIERSDGYLELKGYTVSTTQCWVTILKNHSFCACGGEWFLSEIVRFCDRGYQSCGGCPDVKKPSVPICYESFFWCGAAIERLVQWLLSYDDTHIFSPFQLVDGD